MNIATLHQRQKKWLWHILHHDTLLKKAIKVERMERSPRKTKANATGLVAEERKHEL